MRVYVLIETPQGFLQETTLESTTLQNALAAAQNWLYAVRHESAPDWSRITVRLERRE